MNSPLNMKDQWNASVNQRRDEAYQALVVNVRPQRTIPETVFLKNFYAFFRGEVNDSNDAKAVHRNWMQIAGSQFEEVQIIGVDGRDLYVVPSIAATEAVKTTVKQIGGLKYNAIPADAEQARLNAELPSHVQGALYDSLSKNVEEDEAAMIAHKKKWDDLLAFFDARLGLKPAAKEAEKAAVSKAATDIHDELF